MAERRALSVLAAISAVLLFTSPASGQVRRRGVAPSLAADEEIAWEKYLVKDASEPTFRFAVAHLDAATGCYGYLYITREKRSVTRFGSRTATVGTRSVIRGRPSLRRASGS
jgi:hypothetical protein